MKESAHGFYVVVSVSRLDGFARDDQGRLLLPAHVLDRFWVKVDRSGGPEECWPWQGATESSGYGIFLLNAAKPKVYVRAHRLAYEIVVGLLSDAEVARHFICDRRLCCNPQHLLPGTRAENNQDRKRRGGYAHVALRLDAASRSGSVKARFWSKVDTSGECWVWTSAKDACGYGVFYIDGRMRKAHRVAFEMEEGPLSPEVTVRHVGCDNRACCRRSHLAAGTQAENMADMVAMGRRVWAQGEQASLTKLTDDAVVQILTRVAAGESRDVIAADFGIHRGSIKAFVSGRSRGYLAIDELRVACREAARQKVAAGRALRWRRSP